MSSAHHNGQRVVLQLSCAQRDLHACSTCWHRLLTSLCTPVPALPRLLTRVYCPRAICVHTQTRGAIGITARATGARSFATAAGPRGRTTSGATRSSQGARPTWRCSSGGPQTRALPVRPALVHPLRWHDPASSTLHAERNSTGVLLYICGPRQPAASCRLRL